MSDTPTSDNLTERPCSKCGKPCFRICYIGMRLVCPECFTRHVATDE